MLAYLIVSSERALVARLRWSILRDIAKINTRGIIEKIINRLYFYNDN